MYELPPILSGNAYAQLRQMRDYLVRLINSLHSVQLAAEQSAANTKNVELPDSGNSTNYANLAALIKKTAHTVEHEVERIEQSLSETYLAISDFGEYSEELELKIETSARETLESYDFVSRLDSAESLITKLNAQIRRGLITDPETGETAAGIAISEKLSFSGETQTIGGETYYALAPGQTLGLYTSSGWQFWINGSRRGWFDSVDGMLHTGAIQVEEHMRLGADWQISAVNGLGIRYLGA